MIELTLPEFDVHDKSTKDLIITLLLKQHPLSVKQLWYKINRTFGKNISYQGVYKCVSILLEGEVLRKGEIGYEINMEWVKKVRRFTQSLESSYDRTLPSEIPAIIVS